jgi:hypothetical protein
MVAILIPTSDSCYTDAPQQIDSIS